jgi:hypothetical protein
MAGIQLLDAASGRLEQLGLAWLLFALGILEIGQQSEVEVGILIREVANLEVGQQAF